MSAGRCPHRRRIAQIPLVIDGAGERANPCHVARTDGAIVGIPAIQGLCDLPTHHAETARRAAMATLAARVAIYLTCSNEPRPQATCGVPAGSSQPVDTRFAAPVVTPPRADESGSAGAGPPEMCCAPSSTPPSCSMRTRCPWWVGRNWPRPCPRPSPAPLCARCWRPSPKTLAVAGSSGSGHLPRDVP